jgi:cell division protein FtsL
MKEHLSGPKTRADSSTREREQKRETAPKPVLAVRQRRQIRPFFFSMGPVALSITSVLLIGLMAVLYLSQVGRAVAINHTIQDTRTEQSSLQRKNQDLTSTVAQEQAPNYITDQAKKMGLVPIDPGLLWILKTADILQNDQNDQNDQP